MPSRRNCNNCRRMGHTVRNCPELLQQRSYGHSINHECYICHSPGHNTSLCPLNGANNQQYSMFCFLCEEYGHVLFDCPIHAAIQEHNIVNEDVKPPYMNKPKINWDKCGKCGANNTGSVCECGEKQVTQVQCDANGVFECMICYTDLRELNKVTTKCGHHFCVDCFLNHYTSKQKSSSDCPICRAGLIESKGHPAAPADNMIMEMLRSDPRYQLVLNNIEIVREFNAEVLEI